MGHRRRALLAHVRTAPPTSSTSVIWSSRIVVASRSSTAPSNASAVTKDAWRSRASTCVATGRCELEAARTRAPRPRAGTLACVPTAPVICPTAISAVAAASRVRARRTSSTKIGELDTEGQRLRVDAVGAAHHHGEPVALCLLDQRRDERLDVRVDDTPRRRGAGWRAPCPPRPTRSARGGSTAPPRRPSPGPRRRTPPRRAPARPRARRCARHRSLALCRPASASTGIRPSSAQPSHASNSTSSQRCSRDVSLKIFAICCGAYRGITYGHSIGVTGRQPPCPWSSRTVAPLATPRRTRRLRSRRRSPLGADAVELDVRRTADGVLVVHHNASRRGIPVSMLTYAALVRLEPPRAAASRHGPRSLRRQDRARRRDQGDRLRGRGHRGGVEHVFTRDRLLYTSFEESVISNDQASGSRSHAAACCSGRAGSAAAPSDIEALPFDLAERCGADLLAVHQWLAPVRGRSRRVPGTGCSRRRRHAVPDDGLDGRWATAIARISCRRARGGHNHRPARPRGRDSSELLSG